MAIIPPEIAYGSLEKSVVAADLVISGEAIESTQDCSNITNRPSESQARCETIIEADHIYKGNVHAGDTISVTYAQYPPMDNLYRYTSVGSYGLFILCRSGDGYGYCQNSIGRASMVRPSYSSFPSGLSGSTLLFMDLVNGLRATGDNQRNSELIWALGDVADVSILQKAEKNLSLQARTDLDATIIHRSSTDCGTDLREVSSQTVFDGVGIVHLVDALNQSGKRCLDQIPYLVHSSSANLRLSALHILAVAQDPASIPTLASLIDDKEPAVAFNSMRILCEVTGYKPLNHPSFQEFNEIQAKHIALVEEWKAQLRSRGVEAAP
jgi:hypothetical protein